MFTNLFLVLIFAGFSVCCGKKPSQQVLYDKKEVSASDTRININSASAEELRQIPNIGEKTALAIVEHREKYGRFRKPEHLMFVPRISDKRFREIRNFIKTE